MVLKFPSGGNHCPVERARRIVARVLAGARRAAAVGGKAGTGRYVFAEAGEDQQVLKEGGRRRILPRGGGVGSRRETVYQDRSACSAFGEDTPRRFRIYS